MNQGRRSFLIYTIGGSLISLLIAIFYPILAFLKPPKNKSIEVSSVKVGKLEDIPPDSSLNFRFGNSSAILIRTSSGELKAFDARCTHLDCTVQYRKDMGIIWCACHNGKYDINGRNIAGPPPRPLNSYKVVVQNDEVYVSKI